MESLVAVRVVRGPDWCWEEQDGGEGGVGTVVAVADEGQSAEVQWDCGIRAFYRCGQTDCDLRAFDTAPAGIFFPDVTCAGCYVEGVAGIHWQCAHCYEYYLCHSCYLQGRHCQEHSFFRIQSKKQAHRIKVPARSNSASVQAKGIFPGAEVLRGTNWKFGDQDGGKGNTGNVVAVEGWKNLTARSVAKVRWNSNGTVNVYRVGHRAKVDVTCNIVGNGEYYFPLHLPTFGKCGTDDFFNEDEVVAGDVIVVDLDVEVSKTIHEAAGLWNDLVSSICNHARSGVVLALLDDRRVYCIFEIQLRPMKMILCLDAVSKLKHCRPGMMVQVISDLDELTRVHSECLLCTNELAMTLGHFGRVTQVYFSSRVKVIIDGREWIFSPLCLKPCTSQEATVEDAKVKNLGILQNVTKMDLRQRMVSAGVTNEALLDGDSSTIEAFLSSTTPMECEMLLVYYSLSGMVPAMNMLLKAGVNPDAKVPDGPPLVIACILHHQEEACMSLINAGANVNSDCLSGVIDMSLIMAVIGFGSIKMMKFLVSRPELKLDTKEPQEENTALHCTTRLSLHLMTAVLVASKASFLVLNSSQLNPLHDATEHGLISLLEVFCAHAPEQLNVKMPSGKFPIHVAAEHNYTTIINLLAAQSSVDVDCETEHMVTPLHYATNRGHWSAVEILVGWGAVLNSTDAKGDTPLSNVVKGKNSTLPISPQLLKIHDELSELSNETVEGYVAVACFLICEGADWSIKNKDGVCPKDVLSFNAVSLITECKRNQNPRTFYGSLQRTQHQKMCELPQESSLDVSLAHTEIMNVPTTSISSTPVGQVQHDPEHVSPTPVSQLHSPSENHSTVIGESAYLSSPGESVGLCLLCEEDPASVKFLPCGHQFMCSICAQRARRCLKCTALVESKINVS